MLIKPEYLEQVGLSKQPFFYQSSPELESSKVKGRLTNSHLVLKVLGIKKLASRSHFKIPNMAST